jgi:hypothetical protein
MLGSIMYGMACFGNKFCSFSYHIIIVSSNIEVSRLVTCLYYQEIGLFSTGIGVSDEKLFIWASLLKTIILPTINSPFKISM